VRAVGFRPAMRPSPARPWRPPLSLSCICFSRATTPSLPPLSHLFALGDPVTVITEFWIPKVSSPSPSLPLSPSPSPFPSSLHASPPFSPARGLAARPAPTSHGAAPTAPWHGPDGSLVRPCAWPRQLAPKFGP
jgi:hypothetical protein